MARVVLFDKLQRFLFLSHPEASSRQKHSRDFFRRVVFLLCGVQVSQQPALAIPRVSCPCLGDGVLHHGIIRGLRGFFALDEEGSSNKETLDISRPEERKLRTNGGFP